MKTTALLILLFSLATSCGKEKTSEEEPKGVYHELKTGSCSIYRMSYLRSMDRGGGDTIRKLSENLYTYKSITGQYFIDTIMAFNSTDKLYMSKYYNKFYTDPNDTMAKYYTKYFRNSRTITSDSIVTEYYNAYGWNAGTRTFYKDSGLIAIKVE